MTQAIFLLALFIALFGYILIKAIKTREKGFIIFIFAIILVIILAIKFL